MANTSKQINPVAVAIVIGLFLIVAVAAGIWYMTKPPNDMIAEAVHRERANAASSSAPGAPTGSVAPHPGAPMGGVPPQPGGHDYAPSRPMPRPGGQ